MLTKLLDFDKIQIFLKASDFQKLIKRDTVSFCKVSSH